MQKTRWIACTLTLAALLFTAAAGTLPAAEQVLVSGVESCFLGTQDDRIIWAEDSDISLRTRLKSGGDITSLAHLMGTPVSLTVYDGKIYWIEAADDTLAAFKLHSTSLDGTDIILSNRSTGDSQTWTYQNPAAQGGFIYWAPRASSSDLTYIIEKVPTTGTGAVTLYSTLESIRSLSADDQNLYWIEQSDTGYDMGTVKTMPLAGGAATAIFAPAQADQIYINGVLTASQGQVVWADSDSNGYRLVKSSASGGTPTVLAHLPPDKPGTDSGPTNQPVRIVIDSGNVYWIDQHSVNTIPLNGGTPQVLADNLNYPQDLTVGGGYLYWSERSFPYKNLGSVKKMAVTGGAVTPLTVSVDLVRRLALWNRDVYWAEDYSVSSCNRYDGQIAKIAQGGGPVTPVLGGISMFQTSWWKLTFVSDATAVYFRDGCAIKKVPFAGGPVERIGYLSFLPIMGIDADNDFVYSIASDASIYKTAKDGSGTSKLFYDPHQSNATGSPLRIRGDTIYWGSEISWPSTKKAVSSMPKTGGSATVVAVAVGGVTDFVVDSDYVYVLDATGRQVTRTPLAGGTATVLAPYIGPLSTYLALGAEQVYYINPWAIVGLPKAPGGYYFELGAYGGCGLAAEGDTIYWTNTYANKIFTMYAGPPPPLVSSAAPADGMIAAPDSLLSGRQPAFSWTVTGSCTGFTILFSTSPTDFHKPVASANVSGARTSWTPPASVWKNILKASDNNGAVRNMYWKVVAKQGKKGAETEVRSFKAAPAQVVTINSPASGAILPSGAAPAFDFATASNIKFRLEVSSLSDFSQTAKVKVFNYSTPHPDVDVSLQESLPMASWKAIKKLIGTGPGYFRIKAWDAINRETVSEVRSFTIQ